MPNSTRSKQLAKKQLLLEQVIEGTYEGNPNNRYPYVILPFFNRRPQLQAPAQIRLNIELQQSGNHDYVPLSDACGSCPH